MNKYYYRFTKFKDLGILFNKFWHDCQKAEQKADAWAKKVGAEQYYSSPLAFEGGVTCVSFGDKIPNKRIWKSVGKDADGIEMYEVLCSQRNGMEIMKKNRQPSNTQTRIYSRQWKEQGDMIVVPYIELYREDYEQDKAGLKKQRMNKWQREAVSLERSRLLLPMVPVERLYRLLQADTHIDVEMGKAALVRDTTPMFFDYGNYFYVSTDYPCKHPELQEISSEVFMELRRAKLETQRHLEAIAGN